MALFSNIAEKSLLALWQQGNGAAFGELYGRIAPSIYRYLRFRLPDTLTTQDLTQEVFERILRHRQNGGVIEDFRLFSFTTARHLMADFYAKKARGTSLSLDQVVEATPHLEPGRAGTVEAQAEWSLLREVIKSLPDEEKDLVILRFIEGLSYYEISQIMEKNESAIRVQLHRLRKLIKTIFPV